MYLHLVEIAIYPCLESIGDTIEFQFAFLSKITWNYIIYYIFIEFQFAFLSKITWNYIIYYIFIEFQFAFLSKITWNYIFQASNRRRIILIFSLSEERQ